MFLSFHLFKQDLYISTVTFFTKYSKTCVKRPLSKRPKIAFQCQISLNAGQKYWQKVPRGGAFLQYFRPSSSYHLSLRSLFWLFSGRVTQIFCSTNIRELLHEHNIFCVCYTSIIIRRRSRWNQYFAVSFSIAEGSVLDFQNASVCNLMCCFRLSVASFDQVRLFGIIACPV